MSDDIDDCMDCGDCEETNDRLAAEVDRLREQLRLTSIDQATTEASENEAHGMCNTLRARVAELEAALREIAKIGCRNDDCNSDSIAYNALAAADGGA